MFHIDRTLRKIVSNLWFEWNSDVNLLFRGISPYIWGLFRRNLYQFLKLQAENPALYHHRLAQLLTHNDFFNLFRKVEQNFHDYMHPSETIVSRQYPELQGKTIAYFSMEYGIDIFRTYSGGLGILSGDHLRGASDVGLSMVGMGLFYRQGYYEQVVGLKGEMNVTYETLVPSDQRIRDILPVETVKCAGTKGNLILDVPVKDRIVKVKIWKAKIGRCELLLLDTHLSENAVHDRHITRRLYTSRNHYEEERRRRLEQEIVLGIGGMMALQGAGYDPVAYHLNEGHVAFAALEAIRQKMQAGLSFEEAQKKCAEITGFTTHTPVPEGNERFDENLVRQHIEPYLDGFLSVPERENIFNCARNSSDQFDMTKLGLMLSGVFRNGVSRLHGEECRKMWDYAWGLKQGIDEIPIDSITNAVHVPYWQKPCLRQLIEDEGGVGKVMDIEDEKIWMLHLEFKRKLIEKVRERVAYQYLREKYDAQMIHDKASALLEEDSFMIGFARRFASYKRVTLLLDDEERFFQFLETSYQKYRKPICVLYAGKPHPNNYQGRERVRYIVEVSKRLEERAAQKGFKAQVIFIQGYDIDIARYLEAGVDVWLNNPIRPLEASGTSGMKAGMNGVLNVSIPDGWTPEGVVTGENGWMFGRGDSHSEGHDRNELFRLLEEEILPIYFDRPEGRPFSPRWVTMMKRSIQSITKKFNADRMLSEYIEKMYLPAFHNSKKEESVQCPQ